MSFQDRFSRRSSYHFAALGIRQKGFYLLGTIRKILVGFDLDSRTIDAGKIIVIAS